MAVDIHTFVTGPIETNTYVLCDGDCVIVDPGFEPTEVVDFCRGRNLAPWRILLTHGHGDHIAGITWIKRDFPDVRIFCPAADAQLLGDAWANMSAPFGMPVTAPPPDETISAGDTITLGQSRWAVLDTCGHTPGGVSFYCESAGVVITGDSLFAGGVGRTDIPRADTDRLLANIRENLLTLPGATRVLPGHGGETTIAAERDNNPFLG